MQVQYIDHMGSDSLVVRAARVSFAKDTSTLEEDDRNPDFPNRLSSRDAKLIHYLAEHRHWTPFGHPQIILRMTAPVPIRTQCFKHKVGFVENEESRRYITSTPQLFMPDDFRMKPEGSAKQGSAGVHPDSEGWKERYLKACAPLIEMYERMILQGIAPEQARLVLPQGVEVSWYWTGSLAAYARFYLQRKDPHAQKEIQDLAAQVGDVIRPLFPVSWSALTKEKTHG